jgi:hypothetical protein
MTQLSHRFIRSDLVQLSTLYFAILLFCVLISWPAPLNENRSWFMFVQVRILTLTLLGLAYGASEVHKPKFDQGLTLLALLGLNLLSLPLELACYAASFPATPVYWALGITFIDTIALFGLGIAISKLFHKIRLQALLPVLNIVIIVLLNTIDFGTGTVLISPLLAVTVLSPFHFAAMLVLAIATVVWLLRS